MRMCLIVAAALAGFDPYVPFETLSLDDAVNAAEFRKINAATGLRRFLVTGPCNENCMLGPFDDDVYPKAGRKIRSLRELLKGTDIELGWWCSPSIRYYSDFQPVVNAQGGTSTECKNCPLDPRFIADWCAKFKSVAAVRPKMIFIEDDYSLAGGRGLGKLGSCFCDRHLAAVSRICGRRITADDVAEAFTNRTPANLSVRKAFGQAMRDSLVDLARRVRAAVDEVDPTIRICLCDTGFNVERDGDALEAEIRAFAGRTRPAVRPHGAIYGAATTPERIPLGISHAMFVIERLPRDIEKFYEADTYPHNRFYSSASQILSLMTGAVAMGSDDFLFYCLQYLDDPLEDPGYTQAYLALKPRLEAVREFIRARNARLEGVRIYWTPDDVALTRDQGEKSGHGGQLGHGSFCLAKMSLPYTTRQDAKGPVLLLDGIVEVMSDEEIRTVLSGAVLVDAPAAELLRRRGFADLLGTDVEILPERPRVVGERILPAAGCSRKGKRIYSNYIWPAGTEGTVRMFAKLTPRSGTEVWSEYFALKDAFTIPSVTFATNALGGRVAVLATPVIGNRSSGLYSPRKQELLRRLFLRMAPDSLPIFAPDAPGIWCLANVSADGQEMLVTVNNLSGDVRDDLAFGLSSVWQGAEVSRLGADGKPVPMGTAADVWRTAIRFGQMEPEFFLFRRGK